MRFKQHKAPLPVLFSLSSLYTVWHVISQFLEEVFPWPAFTTQFLELLYCFACSCCKNPLNFESSQ